MVFASLHVPSPKPANVRAELGGEMTFETTTAQTNAPLAYSVNEACRVSSIGRTCLYQLIAEGKLEVRKIGRRTVITARSLRALIEGEEA